MDSESPRRGSLHACRAEGANAELHASTQRLADRIEVFRLRLTYIVNRICWGPMINGYRDRKTERFASGRLVRDFQGFEQQAVKRLVILNAAPSLATLRTLPSNRLEALGGDRKGQYSIRINRQWRICFEWPEGQSGPSSVEIVDYHS